MLWDSVEVSSSSPSWHHGEAVVISATCKGRNKRTRATSVGDIWHVVAWTYSICLPCRGVGGGQTPSIIFDCQEAIGAICLAASGCPGGRRGAKGSIGPVSQLRPRFLSTTNFATTQLKKTSCRQAMTSRHNVTDCFPDP
ncbi:hypothetical protein BC937DRAFT_94852 [Endogone sp. FLAS-F59071]|nr:hypothetical protein BC937DRAFT_94852 [Endogone sp. FLAS-F59071]|eukprot:RUS20600.1 hypothetical protein BC937DRAFT_94852 [Endogone sp. FLAS-F59071]